MGGVKSRTRNGDDWTDRFTELDPALGQLSCDTGLIDGEIVAGVGLEGFAALREAIKAGGPFRYVAFDLLISTGRSCRTIPSTPAARRWSICSATRPPWHPATSPCGGRIGDRGAADGLRRRWWEGLIFKRRTVSCRRGKRSACATVFVGLREHKAPEEG